MHPKHFFFKGKLLFFPVLSVLRKIFCRKAGNKAEKNFLYATL